MPDTEITSNPAQSMYTGVHANGGPSTVDKEKVIDISVLMDRSPADLRGVKYDGVGSYSRSDSGKKLSLVCTPNHFFYSGSDVRY